MEDSKSFPTGSPIGRNEPSVSIGFQTQLTKKNSVVVVRKPTIPTDRPPLFGEVSAKLCG
jgi:hypothetical protein